MITPGFKSLLYVPADKPRMMEKARQLTCKAVIFDLEDAVAMKTKAWARENLAKSLDQPFPLPFFVRINASGTENFEADLNTLADIKPLGIILPKATREAVTEASAILDELEFCPASIRIIPLIESALAVETLPAILDASPRISAAQLGAEDLTADLGIQRTVTGEEISYARHRVVYSCRARGLPAYDTPFLDFRDNQGLENDALTARNTGFAGKVCIHPSQIEIINQAFSPSPAEVEEARILVAAADKAKGGAFSLNGRMVDGPVVDRARRILEQAD